jgi:hypothetical protein
MADKATRTAVNPVNPAVTPAVAAPPATWFIDANTLTCVAQQETNATHGDEVYVASLKFRTKPGVAATTSVFFTGGLVDIEDVNTGETHTIPNSMGRISFPSVTRLGAEEIDAGESPEVIGTATILVESDLSRNAKIDKLFTESAAEVVPILAAAAEQVVFEDLLATGALNTLIGKLVDDVNEALERTLGQKLALFLSSGADPDDEIDRKLNIFVAVDDVLAPLVDAAFAAALDPDDGVGGGLRTRSYTQRFAGRGAKYDLSFSVSK